MDVAFAGLAVFGVSRLEPPTEPCQSMLRSSLGTFTRVLAKPDGSGKCCITFSS